MHGHHHEQSGDCCADACDCCVPRADVVVRARAGERRLVPFTLRNPTRRERTVTLAVGPFHPCGGDELDLRAAFLEGESLTLAPCESVTVRLVLTVLPVQQKPDQPTTPDGGKTDPGKTDPAKSAAAGDVIRARLEDVTRCSTAYADVRFEGCGRPMRVAVVVLPAECDAVEVCCECGCC